MQKMSRVTTITNQVRVGGDGSVGKVLATEIHGPEFESLAPTDKAGPRPHMPVTQS